MPTTLQGFLIAAYYYQPLQTANVEKCNAGGAPGGTGGAHAAVVPGDHAQQPDSHSGSEGRHECGRGWASGHSRTGSQSHPDVLQQRGRERGPGSVQGAACPRLWAVPKIALDDLHNCHLSQLGVAHVSPPTSCWIAIEQMAYCCTKVLTRRPL